MTLLGGLVSLMVAVSVALYCMRIAVRHFFRDKREAVSGELEWFRLTPEGRSRKTGRSPELQNTAVKTFLSQLQGDKYSGRPVASIIWNKDQDSGMVVLYVGLSSEHSSDSRSVHNLARELNCRAQMVDAPPEINPNGMAVGFRRHTQPGSVFPQPLRLGQVAETLGVNSEISGSIVLTLEGIRDSEVKRYISNFNEEAIRKGGDTVSNSGAFISERSHTVAGSAVRGSIAAFSDSGEYTQSVSMLRSALGSLTGLGYNYSIGRMTKPYSRLVPLFVLASCLLSGFFMVLGMSPIVGFVSIALSIAAGVVHFVPSLNGMRAAHRRAEKGEITVPSFFYLSLRFMLHAAYRGAYLKNAGGDEAVGNRVAHPSGPQVFTMYGTSVSEFITVPESYQSTNIERDGVPRIPMAQNLVSGDGIWLGKDGEFNDIHMLVEDLPYGAFIAGMQGSGKSNLLLSIFAGVSKYSCSASNTKGYKINPIWAETKGEGSYSAWRMVEKVPRSLFIDSHNPLSKFRLALEGPRVSDGASPRDVIRNSEALVSALQFAFGDGIKSESRQGLDHSIRLALLMSPEELRGLGFEGLVDVERPNIIELAFLFLIGNPNHDPGPRLMQLATEYEPEINNDLRKRHVYESIMTLSAQYAGDQRTRNQAIQRFAPPRNKLSDLRNAREFWTPSSDKIDIYIQDIVNHFAPIVLNLGPYYNPELRKYTQDFSTQVAKYLIKTFNYAIWNYIKAECSGWQAQGKYIPLFFDEVKDIAQDSSSDDIPNVLEEGGQQGRSRGCGYFVATQYPSQLPHSALNEVMNFSTKCWFTLNLESDVAMAYRSFTYGEDEADFDFSKRNIPNLPHGFAIITLKRGEQRSNAFTLLTPYSMNVKKAYDQSPTITDAIRLHDQSGMLYTRSGIKVPDEVIERRGYEML